MSDNSSSYRVVIPYREPTYETYKGSSPENPYRAYFQVVAHSVEEAVKKALELFQQYKKNSHVGWDRVPEYDNIEVEPL